MCFGLGKAGRLAIDQVRKGPSRNTRLALLRNVLAVVVAAWFFLYSVLPTAATPYGVQCPTAPVQTITVAMRICCGKVARIATRAPKPGDKDFVQCRCAEKKGTAQKSIVQAKAPVLLVSAVRIADSAIVPLPLTACGYDTRYSSLGFPPLVLPPVCA